MLLISSLFVCILCVANTSAAPAVEVPTKVVKRADVCGTWDSVTTGTYIMYNDHWGASAATSGSQCAGVDSLSGTTVKWHTTWTWAGGSYSVKSYSQIYENVSSAKKVSAVSTYPSSWSWTYTGSNLVANVAYDIFTYTTVGGSATYEIMIWLAALGGAGPISSTGSPIATVTVAGRSWKLYYGLNGSTKVYSFVANGSSYTNFSGDLKSFFTYLATSQNYPTSQYIMGAAAGTEPFTGSGAKLTSTYSAKRN